MKDHKKQYIAKITARFISTLILLGGISGCGEVAYKRGGNATELQQIRQICQKQGNDQKQIESCLAEHGWAVQHLNVIDPDPVIEASYAPDNRQPTQFTHEKKSTTLVNSSPSERMNASPDTTNVLKEPLLAKQATDLFKINSWWRLGNNATLNTDIQQCVEQLGTEHQPDKELHRATRALLQCMNTKGWKALREK